MRPPWNVSLTRCCKTETKDRTSSQNLIKFVHSGPFSSERPKTEDFVVTRVRACPLSLGSCFLTAGQEATEVNVESFGWTDVLTRNSRMMDPEGYAPVNVGVVDDDPPLVAASSSSSSSSSSLPTITTTSSRRRRPCRPCRCRLLTDFRLACRGRHLIPITSFPVLLMWGFFLWLGVTYGLDFFSQSDFSSKYR